MNVTEQFEEVLRLARQSPHAWEPTSQRVLAVFAKRAQRMREKLDAARRRKEYQKLKSESYLHLRDELERLRKCDVCLWNNDISDGTINPLKYCTGDFGCALECLRYKSCPWYPDLLKK